ncbi:MAG: AFG1/ZapE family ATPase, partial [Dokdonella sp.]
DELYDRHVNLLLSAAASPNALYRGHRHRVEFERAQSRLIEMQSADYLALEHRP